MSKARSQNRKIAKFTSQLSLAAGIVLLSLNTASAGTVKCNVYTTDANDVALRGGEKFNHATDVGGVKVCNLGTYDPRPNDNLNGQTTVDNDTVLFKGVGSSVGGTSSGVTWEDVTKSEYFEAKQGSSVVDISGKVYVPLTTGNDSTAVADPVAGGVWVIRTFADNELKEQLQQAEISTGAGDMLYMNARFATATNNATLRVNLDDLEDSKMNFFGAKSTTLFKAESGSTIQWEGNSRIKMWQSIQAKAVDNTKPITTATFHTYQDVNFNGTTYRISSLDEFKAYNRALKQAMTDGILKPAKANPTKKDYEDAYMAQLKKALREETFQIYRKSDTSKDESIAPVGANRVIHASGPNSKAIVKSGSTLMHNYGYTGIAVDGGATGEIEEGGRFGGFGYNVVVSGSNSVFNNKGVISSGYNALNKNTDSSYTANPHNNLSSTEGNFHQAAFAASVSGGGTFNNEGIINVSSSDTWGYQNFGISLHRTGGKATNKGVINALINSNAISEQNYTVTGVKIEANDAGVKSAFDNEGEIYVGRTAQEVPGQATRDVEEKKATFGIWQQGKAEVTHSGSITTGSKLENSIAYFLDNAKESTVNLKAGSNIIVKGNKANNAAGAPPLTNYGLYALNTGNSTINADGNIILEGVNARAIQAEGDSTVNVAETGYVKVHGGRDIRQGARNYGVYAEGSSNAATAKVNFKGKMDLTGTSAIGLHARGYAKIDNAGKVEMIKGSGTDQIGYFLHGPNAELKGQSTELDVTTDRSVMFRIAEGAEYSTKGMSITTSGKGSTAIVVTGETGDFDGYKAFAPKKSNVSTAGGTYNITGEGSRFIIVEGGAQAKLDYTSRVNLLGPKAVIGIVDGQGYGLFGDTKGTLKEDSYLSSSLVTQSDLNGVNTYVTRSSGNLDFNGSYINLYGGDSIAFKMQDGGRLKVAESASFIVNGDAIRSEEQNDESGLNRGETNTARLERNEINAINILNARSGAVTVDSRGQSLLTGAAQTEASANSRLSLSEETVWNITDNSKLTTLINRGTMNFVGQITDPKDRKQYQQLEIAGDYLGVGGSTLSVNSNWYQTEGVFTNTVVIKGDATGQTRVIATDGIGGDVKAPQAGETGSGIEMLADNRFLKYDSASPVISVLGSDNFDNGNPTFVGDAVIRDSAEQVQLIKKGRHYYWAMTGVLPAKESQKEEAKPVDTGKKIYVPETSAYLQTPYINRQQSFDLLGKLTDRVGEQQFDCDCLGPQSWSRLSYHDGYSQGKNRFGFGSKRGLVQFGQDLSFNMNETRRVHTGISVGYSWSQNRFYDKYRSENGYISADKETLGSKSQVASLGLYRTAYFANGSYLDLNLNGNWIHNQYNTENRHHKPSQNGYSLGASVETGRLFKLGESHWYVQPQAQLRAQYQHLNRFKDGSRQTEAKAQTGLQARLGARLTNGTFHVSADLVHDIIAPKTAVTIGNSRLEERYNPTTAELAVGGDIGLDSNGKWKLYSDAKYTRALGKANNVFGKKAPAESYNARIGVRYSW